MIKDLIETLIAESSYFVVGSSCSFWVKSFNGEYWVLKFCKIIFACKDELFVGLVEWAFEWVNFPWHEMT